MGVTSETRVSHTGSLDSHGSWGAQYPVTAASENVLCAASPAHSNAPGPSPRPECACKCPACLAPWEGPGRNHGVPSSEQPLQGVAAVYRAVCMINRRGPEERPPHPGVCVREGQSVGAGLPGPQTWALGGAGDMQVAGRLQTLLQAHCRDPGASAPATCCSCPHPHCHSQGQKFRAGVSGVSKALPRPAQLSPLQQSTAGGASREGWPGTSRDRPGG